MQEAGVQADPGLPSWNKRMGLQATRTYTTGDCSVDVTQLAWARHRPSMLFPGIICNNASQQGKTCSRSW